MRGWGVVALLAACSAPTPAPSPAGPLAVAESLYLDLRDIRDRIDVTGSAGRTVASDGTPILAFAGRHNSLRQELVRRLDAVDSTALSPGDARAFRTMRAVLAADLAPVTDSLLRPAAAQSRPRCDYDPAAIAAGKNGLDSLRRRIYACYAWAQHHVPLGADTMDRLSVLGALGRTDDPLARRRLFLSLEPVWRSVNRGNGPESPYRRLIGLEATRRTTGGLPAAQQARLSGVPPDSLERWLLAILQTWRDVSPDSLIEPWDWYYQNGRAARTLGGRISRQRLTRVNAAVYRAMGADPRALNVRYDLVPREGKTPVAFCTFGARPPVR